MTENMTICVECKHYVKSAVSFGRYNKNMLTTEHDTCKRAGKEGHRIYCVTGEAAPVAPYPYCRDINKGACKDFEERESDAFKERKLAPGEEMTVNVLMKSWERLPVTRWERLKS